MYRRYNASLPLRLRPFVGRSFCRGSSAWMPCIDVDGQYFTVPKILVAARFRPHCMTMSTFSPLMASRSYSAFPKCLRSYLNMALRMPLNRLRVFGSKFFTIAAGLKHRFSIVSLSRWTIIIFILKSAMIVLLFDMSSAIGFVVHRIVYTIWLCVARHSRVLGFSFHL